MSTHGPDSWVKSGYRVFWSRPESEGYRPVGELRGRRRPSRPFWRRWTPAVALMVALVLMLGSLAVLFRGSSSSMPDSSEMISGLKAGTFSDGENHAASINDTNRLHTDAPTNIHVQRKTGKPSQAKIN